MGKKSSVPAGKSNNLLQETNETSIRLFKVNIYSKLTNEQEFLKHNERKKYKPRNFISSQVILQLSKL